MWPGGWEEEKGKGILAGYTIMSSLPPHATQTMFYVFYLGGTTNLTIYAQYEHKHIFFVHLQIHQSIRK